MSGASWRPETCAVLLRENPELRQPSRSLFGRNRIGWRPVGKFPSRLYSFRLSQRSVLPGPRPRCSWKPKLKSKENENSVSAESVADDENHASDGNSAFEKTSF